MKREIKLPLTIERQLESYYLSDSHTERHEILWHAWNQNKRWINQLLQMTLAAFPTYSKHDESHASSVLHNIEMILGEERIAQLSASDCFVLLHTVYIHDIGMCITYEDRANIVKNRAFLDMVDELEVEGDHSLSKAIEALKKTDYSYENEEEEIEKTQKLYEDKLQVYYALIHLIANYRRAEHGTRSKEILYEWTLEPNKLGIGFSLAGIPLRIFLAIANSAQLHTNPTFKEILDLPQEDDGYALDYYHPRFISVLLQLGDILDMDNNRFHPLTKECMGSLPELSEQHYDKHLAIRRLHIRPDKISIEADCRTQEALRLVRKECDMLIGMLQSAGYYWSVICPPDFIGSLPTVEDVKLSLDGQRIPEELVTTQFRISQKKAFSLLEGANVYSGRFVFLREFLQNAVDATKMQYWSECCSTKGYYDNPKLWKKQNPYELNKKVSVENFPIEIEMEIQKQNNRGELSSITEEDIELLDAKRDKDTYGVTVRIKDFGTGIDKNRILDISKVGSSRKNERFIIENMPEWLRPTAEFGVGLQSAFLVANTFKCKTRTRTGQRYEITFGAVATSRYEGYINVKPVEKFPEQEDTFGTCFEVFVPNEKKFLHQDCYEAWNGEDPFDEYYECRRPLRHSMELLSQMALYLDKQVGELLFPLRLHVKSGGFVASPLNTTGKSKMERIDIGFISKQKEETLKKKSAVKIYRGWFFDQRQRLEKGRPSWIYSADELSESAGVFCDKINQIQYLFDVYSGKLKIWDGDKNVFVAVSAKNLIALEEMMTDSGQNRFNSNGIRVYYKGIELQRRYIEEDSELIEYIDIKGGLHREHINLNRHGFTAEGDRYFQEKIYKPIIATIKKVLRYIAQQYKNNKGDLPKYDFPRQVSRVVKARCKDLLMYDNEVSLLEKGEHIDRESGQKNDDENYLNSINRRDRYLKQLEEQIVSLVMLAYLAMREEYDQIVCADIDNRDITMECPWGKVINHIREVLYNNGKVLELLKKESSFFNLISYDESCNYTLGRNDSGSKRQRITIADIFCMDYSYAIAQERDKSSNMWKQHLIQISRGDIARWILELKFIRSRVQKKESEKNIGIWGEMVLKNAKNFREDYYIQDESKQQFVIKWLLKSVPTIGIFSNKEGTIRINVLNVKTMPFVYVNNNFKLLVAHRILERWKRDRIQRFSTFSWHSNFYLSCKNVPYNIYYVKRGYIRDDGLQKVIIPLGNKEFAQISAILENNSLAFVVSEIYQLYEKVSIERYISLVCDKYSEKEKDKLSEQEQEIYEMLGNTQADRRHISAIKDAYMDLIIGEIERRCRSWTYEEWKKEASEFKVMDAIQEQEASWQEIFVKIIKIYNTYINDQTDKAFRIYTSGYRSLAKSNDFWQICQAWLYISYNYINIANQQMKIPQVREQFFKDLKKDATARGKYDRILQYISDHSDYNVTEDNLKECYTRFAEEVFSLYELLEIRKTRDVLKRISERGIEQLINRIKGFFDER